MVERLDRLRLDAIVGSHDEHGNVGHLSASGTHGGEGLVTRRVDERDRAIAAIGVGRDLVGADVLRDAACLAGDHVGLADRVEQLRLAVVDVAHDRDDRRTRHEVGLVALVLAEIEGEGLEELAILILGRDHLDVEVELAAEELQRVVVNRLGRRDHLAELEEHGHQVRGARIDLLREVREARPARQAHDLAVAAGQAHPTDGGCLHVVEFLALRALGLAAARGTTAGLAEGTRRAATTAGAAATTGTAGEPTARRTTGGASAGSAPEAATRATGTAPTGCATGTARRTAGTAGCATGTAGCAGGTRTRARNARDARHHARGRPGDAGHGRRRAPHAGVAGEGVVARARCRRPGSLPRGDIAREGVVTRARARGAGWAGGLSVLPRRSRSNWGSGLSRLSDRRRRGRLGHRLGGDDRSLFDDGRRLLGGGSLLGRALGLGLRGRSRRHGVLQLADDGRFDRGRSRAHEFAELRQLGEHDLALDSELLSELVDPDLRHDSPVFGPGARYGRAAGPSVLDDPAHGWVLIGGSSSDAPSLRLKQLRTFGQLHAPRELPQHGEIQCRARTQRAGERLAALGDLQAAGVQPCSPPRSGGLRVRGDYPFDEDHPQEAFR